MGGGTEACNQFHYLQGHLPNKVAMLSYSQINVGINELMHQEEEKTYNSARGEAP